MWGLVSVREALFFVYRRVIAFFLSVFLFFWSFFSVLMKRWLHRCRYLSKITARRFKCVQASSVSHPIHYPRRERLQLFGTTVPSHGFTYSCGALQRVNEKCGQPGGSRTHLWVYIIYASSFYSYSLPYTYIRLGCTTAQLPPPLFPEIARNYLHLSVYFVQDFFLLFISPFCVIRNSQM